jgi:thiol:disulfide interchange protein
MKPIKTHRTDRVSLAFGLVFLATVAWWLVGRNFSIDLPAAGWLVAAALIVFGVLGLVGALRSDRGRDADTEVAETATEEHTEVLR